MPLLRWSHDPDNIRGLAAAKVGRLVVGVLCSGIILGHIRAATDS